MESTYSDIEMELTREEDFIKYLHLLKKVLKKYIIFIAVNDTAVGPETSKEALQEFRSVLNLKTDLSDKFRFPYAAIIDRGKVIKEICPPSPETPVEIRTSLHGLEVYILSRGFISNGGEIVCGKSTISINGVNYADLGRGFNFVIFDPMENEAIDICKFDGYDNFKTGKMYKINFEANNFVKIHPGVKFIIYRMPSFPSNAKMLTENEIYLFNNGTKHTDVVENAEDIYEKELSPLCEEFNNLEDFIEVISTPKSYIDVNGFLKFEDKIGNKVNILNGIRVTPDQPDNPKRAIFLVGGCTTFGVGADDYHSIASYLQRRLNLESSDKQFIVFNYGFFIWRNLNKFLRVLKSIPCKNGDIVFIAYPCPLKNMLLLDLSDMAQRPHNYGEIFYAKDLHYTSNGYHLMADKIYEFLKSNKFFDTTTIAENLERGGGIRTINCRLVLLFLILVFSMIMNQNYSKIIRKS